MNSEVPYEDVRSAHSLIKLIDPCVRKQRLYAHPPFPDDTRFLEEPVDLALTDPGSRGSWT